MAPKVCVFLIILPNFSLVSALCFRSIISFGDSIADTGNAVHLLPEYSNRGQPRPPFFTLPPYGETFFTRPTGRCSDGRLIIDFIAPALGLPFVAPFHGGGDGGNFLHGVNFAVVGATASEDTFFRERDVTIPVANASLSAQLSWFNQFLAQICHSTPSDCKRFLETSLIVLGEIGGNDYNHAFLQGIAPTQVESFVPHVINTIGSAINELIDLGAVTLVVPGNFPIGCASAYLTYFDGENKTEYDSETGCIRWLNKFAEYHNELLRDEIARIQELHPRTTIIYADYYNAAMDLYRAPQIHGFAGGALRACCGGGGPYNVNLSVQCGYSDPRLCCEDPSSYVNWDGVHFTEAVYSFVAMAVLRGDYTSPQLATICPLLSPI